MPHYDYKCAQCAHTEEILQKMTDAPLTKCPQCQQSTFKRQCGKGSGLQFQGTGFYSTDYGSPSTPKDNPPASPSSSCGCGKNLCKS